jgi:Recombination endonuclease VII
MFTPPEGETRPPTPRPIKARGYCASHLREVEQAERERTRDRLRAKRYGITGQQFGELVDAQGGGCACGLTHSASRNHQGKLTLHTDHDHEREAKCVAAGRHPEGVACPLCVRGALGARCNREIVGRFTPQQLRNLAAYMERPTAERLGWWDGA